MQFLSCNVATLGHESDNGILVFQLKNVVIIIFQGGNGMRYRIVMCNYNKER